tara:strand:+ start:132 stop:305 length:174 start_codon:yes stop_codon:yes gene_type:complete
MIKPFKINKKHLEEFPELESVDIGLYAIKIREGQPLMIYETKQIANKAYEYFKKNFR